MSPTPTKFLATAAATFLTTSAAFADYQIKRIDHPNGKPTFAPRANSRCFSGATCSKDRETIVENVTRSSDRVTRIRVGRGQYIPVRHYIR